MAGATTGRAERRARRDAYVAARDDATRRLRAGNLEAAVQLLDSPWSGVRVVAVRELRKRGWAREAFPTLLEHAAREGDDSVRLSIALALRDLEDPRATDTLWMLFERGSDEVRLAALQGLSLLGDDRVIPIAISWYQSRGWSLMDRARRSIGVSDLVILQTSGGDKALAELLASEKSWPRRLLIRRAIRSARRWLAQRS